MARLNEVEMQMISSLCRDYDSPEELSAKLEDLLHDGLVNRIMNKIVPEIAELVTDIVQLSLMVQSERQTRKMRQAQGIAAAREAGVKFGRPEVELPPDFAEVIARWESGKINLGEALEQTGLKESTFYRRLRAHRRQAQAQTTSQA